MFSNMFDLKKVDLKKDASFFIDIKDQIKVCCTDFGKVVQIQVDQGSSEGRIWVRFDPNDIRGAIKTQEALDTQYFDQRQIKVQFCSESTFN